MGNAYQLERIDFSRINVEGALVIAELSATDVFSSREVDFHFGCSLAYHGKHRHTGSYGFVCLEQMLLDVSVERSIEFGISQFVLVMFVKGSDLFQTIYGLVVGHGGSAAIVVEGDDTFGFALHLLVLGFGSIKLDLVIRRVQFGQKLTGFHGLSVFYLDATNRTTYPESQADVFRSLDLSRILQERLATFHTDGIRLYGLCLIGVFYLFTTRSEDAACQESSYQ